MGVKEIKMYILTCLNWFKVWGSVPFKKKIRRRIEPLKRDLIQSMYLFKLIFYYKLYFRLFTFVLIYVDALTIYVTCVKEKPCLMKFLKYWLRDFWFCSNYNHCLQDIRTVVCNFIKYFLRLVLIEQLAHLVGRVMNSGLGCVEQLRF